MIEWLNPERTTARVTRRRRWWSRKRVTAVLYRYARCSRDRDGVDPHIIGWLFVPEAGAVHHNDWWSGSKALERARDRALHAEQLAGTWEPVRDEPIPRARIVAGGTP